mmetsp:Transcript_96518/g.282101  ORF Transcript_96518/g.282101 Transcript_96518/m.282101 type:complete len:219 (-) Transcript_96518:412-1068(-)
MKDPALLALALLPAKSVEPRHRPRHNAGDAPLKNLVQLALAARLAGSSCSHHRYRCHRAALRSARMQPALLERPRQYHLCLGASARPAVCTPVQARRPRPQKLRPGPHKHRGSSARIARPPAPPSATTDAGCEQRRDRPTADFRLPLLPFLLRPPRTAPWPILAGVLHQRVCCPIGDQVAHQTALTPRRSPAIAAESRGPSVLPSTSEDLPARDADGF